MNLMKKLFAALAFVPAMALASGGGYPLDRAPERTELASLQNGAKLFVNHCLNCHSAVSMRYNRLRDLGLTEEQIKQNLLFTGEKVGELMKTTLSAKDAKEWFGANPPDLSVIARAKSSSEGTGADYLYTYLRTFYKDDSRPTGWNNLVFPNVGMPHVLWEMQGIPELKPAEHKAEHASASASAHGSASASASAEEHGAHALPELQMYKPGNMTKLQYDTAVADLVGYLSWMAEPAQGKRKTIGVWVLMFMSLLAFLAWRLNASYWKEVK
jgi:ubiquinol-cytochrome c reductase cytochrome c1 subunit